MEFYENIYITKYKNDENYVLHLKLDNNKFRTEKSIIIKDKDSKSIKKGLISLVSDINYDKIQIKFN